MKIVVWNKKELAEAIDITPEYLTKILRGDRNLSLEKKKSLLIFYKIKLGLINEQIEIIDRELKGQF